MLKVSRKITIEIPSFIEKSVADDLARYIRQTCRLLADDRLTVTYDDGFNAFGARK